MLCVTQKFMQYIPGLYFHVAGRCTVAASIPFFLGNVLVKNYF